MLLTTLKPLLFLRSWGLSCTIKMCSEKIATTFTERFCTTTKYWNFAKVLHYFCPFQLFFLNYRNLENITTSKSPWKKNQQVSAFCSIVEDFHRNFVKLTKASTVCLSLGELTITPNDSDVTWRSDGHF